MYRNFQYAQKLRQEYINFQQNQLGSHAGAHYGESWNRVVLKYVQNARRACNRKGLEMINVFQIKLYLQCVF